MPTPAYMSIEGTRQGNITKGAFTEASVGNIYVEGHPNEILVQAFEHEINIPRDSQSGQPTGRRIHEALRISKAFDKASPLLYLALITGETLTQVVIKFYRISASGTLEHYFTIELEDAIILGIEASMAHCQEAANQNLTPVEIVSFSCRKITWAHEVAGTHGADDWRKPRE